MVTLSFPVYFQNITDTAPNAPTQLAQPSLSSASTTFLFLLEQIGASLFSPVLCLYSCISRDNDVYDLSHFCLLINEDDVRSSSFNHPITLYTEIPQNLYFVPLALECVCTTDLPIPFRPSHTVAMYIPRHVVMSPLVIKHWANMLHSLSLCTSYT